MAIFKVITEESQEPINSAYMFENGAPFYFEDNFYYEFNELE